LQNIYQRKNQVLINDLLKQDDSKKVIENPKLIEFSTKTVRFGNSIYQLRNVTGFEVGEIPKQKLQIMLVIGLIIGGCLLLAIGVGLILLGIAAWMIFSHLTQAQKYGFILELNSGGNTSFINSDKIFLGNIVSNLYQLMEGDIDGFVVNWQDRTVNIYGDAHHSVFNSGDSVRI
jgi:Family of unknown function (DUF6232)